MILVTLTKRTKTCSKAAVTTSGQCSWRCSNVVTSAAFEYVFVHW